MGRQILPTSSSPPSPAPGTGTGNCSATAPASRGDTATQWFRSRDACFEAITAEMFFHWASGQSDGPGQPPATAAELPDQDRQPYPGWTD